MMNPFLQGEWVYGGSDLTAVRGGFDAVSDIPMAPALRLAINQAACYHASVEESYPGFVASRINYEVVQGRDDAGIWRSGVLEQSWRVGGATGAEVAALEVFREQPDRAVVRASCFTVDIAVDALSTEQSRQDYGMLLVTWMTEMTLGAHAVSGLLRPSPASPA